MGRLFTALMTLLMLPMANAATEILISEMPPYVNAGGKDGIAVDTLAELFKRSGIEYKFQVVPLKRAVISAKDVANTCAAPVERSQDRETDYKWVSPVLITQTSFFTQSGDKTEINSLDDAKAKTVGVALGSNAESYLKGFNFKVETANENANPKKLKAGRIGIWAADTISGPYYAKQDGMELREAFTFSTTLAALACNNKISDQTIETLNQNLTKMYQDGTMKKIFDKYTSSLGITSKALFLK